MELQHEDLKKLNSQDKNEFLLLTLHKKLKFLGILIGFGIFLGLILGGFILIFLGTGLANVAGAGCVGMGIVIYLLIVFSIIFGDKKDLDKEYFDIIAKKKNKK